MDFKS
jgi:hypothetical protein